MGSAGCIGHNQRMGIDTHRTGRTQRMGSDRCIGRPQRMGSASDVMKRILTSLTFHCVH
jgi:hypothetical protein